MSKRYQVFVSSTYKDLKDQRALVIKHIHDMGHFPVGMEIFPASDQTQWDYITSIIDQSDFYILILGGCYGSLDADGKGFTEKEYLYAVEQNLHVLVLFQNEIEELPAEKRDDDLKRVNAFRSLAMQSRLARSWTDESDLIAGVIISLQKAIEKSTAIGWVRADKVLSEKDHLIINQNAAENTRLQKELNRYKQRDALSEFHNIADLSDEFSITFKESACPSVNLTWSEIWSMFGGAVLEVMRKTGDEYARANMLISTVNFRLLQQHTPGNVGSIHITDFCYDTIEAQFQAYQFVRIDKDGDWFISEKGNRALIAARIATKEEGA